MQQRHIFRLANEEWYERLGRYPVDDTYEKQVRAHLTDAWTCHRSDMWLQMDRPPATVPAQGFKIHVSSIPECALDALHVVAEECVARGISFKCAAGPELHAMVNGKTYGRGGGGKFVTIYPPDHASFLGLIEAVHQRTMAARVIGPYILSDRRYKNSQAVFYRYGTMRPAMRVLADGTRQGRLISPDGNELADVRLPYFSLPEWVEDPFPHQFENSEPLLHSRFEISSMITASNRGGVYHATDITSGESVIVKEARPHIERVTRHGKTIDSQVLLRHEYEVLKRLEHLPCTATGIALFSEWEHLFMAQQKLEGSMLRSILVTTENMWLPYVRTEDSLREFLPKFRTLAFSLIDAVDRIHRCGVIIGDLSPSNVIVDPTSWTIGLIDFETAIRIDQDDDLMPVISRWGTPGFCLPDRSSRNSVTFEDDYYAMSQVLFNCLIVTVALFELKRDGRKEFFEFLKRLGVPSWTQDSVEAVAAGDLSGARRTLAAAAA